MKFAIFVDQLTDGLDTPGGTEAQYVFALAKMLAYYGHQVDCYGGNYTDPPNWGTQAPIPNIRFLNYWTKEDIVYDAFINIPHSIRDGTGTWHYCIDTHIKAKKYLHCMFSWTDRSEENVEHKCWLGYDHLICLPWDLKEYRNDNPNIRFIPFPYYRIVDHLEDNDNRNGIFWAARDPFSDGFEDDPLMAIYGTKLIEAVAGLSNSYNAPCTIFNARAFDTKRAKELGATRAFESIKNKTVYKELVSKTEIIEALQTSRIAVTPPDQMGSCMDAMVNGAIPILFRPTIPFENYCAEGFDYIFRMNQVKHHLTIGMTTREIQDKLTCAYTVDDPKRKELLAQIKKGYQFRQHSWEGANNKLMETLYNAYYAIGLKR